MTWLAIAVIFLSGTLNGYAIAQIEFLSKHLKKQRTKPEAVRGIEHITCVCGHRHEQEQCTECSCRKHIVLDWEKQQ